MTQRAVSPPQGNLLLEAALAYAARGWQVFPCHTPTETGCSCTKRTACKDVGKHPRTKNGLKDATTDEATIRRWWQMWPQANIGIATGAASGLVVFDYDRYKEGSEEAFHDLERSYRPLPETVLSLTGGGGEQYFFSHPGTYVKNGVESLGAGLDIRGDGGYVVAPPSLHVSGKRYTWEVCHEPEDTPLAPMPDWLLALCQETQARETIDAGAPIPQGTRNDTLFRVGCSLRARGCTEAVILAALRAMNTTQCQPPLPDEDIPKLAASCAKYAPGTASTALHHQRNGDTPAAEAAPDQDAPEEDYPYSDAYNALCLVRTHRQEMRYCAPWKTWLTWCGTHWQRDTTGLLVRWQRQTVKALGAQVANLEDEAAKKLMGHIKSSLSTSRLKAAVEQAHSWEGISIDASGLDTHLWLINCQNGTLELKTGELRPHKQKDMLTKCLPIAYDPEARCPQWIAFLEKAMAGSAELIVFLQRALGYSLTGSTREQCFFLLHGPTKTGKSTFVNIAKALLGPYGTQAEMSTFLHKDRETVRNDLADLAGMRLVAAIETDEGKRLAEALVKQLTGGTDALKARFLFEEYFEFRPQFKVFLATNHKPKVNAADDALWERVKLVPFVVQIPKEDRDKQLETKLLAELPGILAWAVRGCLAWQKDDSLTEPAAVVAATAGYREEMDTVGHFLDECCMPGNPEYARVKATMLASVYHAWCKRTGNNSLGNLAFIDAMEKRGYTRQRGHANQYYWHGIGLDNTEDGKDD